MEYIIGVLGLVVTISTVYSGRAAAKQKEEELERIEYRRIQEDLRRADKTELFSALRVVEQANVSTNNTITNHIAFVKGRERNDRVGD